MNTIRQKTRSAV